MGRKTALAFNAVETVDTDDQYTPAESSFVLRSLAAVWHFGVLAPLALLGILVTWADRARLRPLLWMLSAFFASLVAFYVVGRYRLPMAPFLVLYAAAGVSAFPAFVRSNGNSRIAAVLACAVAAAIFCNWKVVDADYMRSVTHYNMGNEFAARERTEAAAEEYRRAIRLYAGNALATNNLGVMLANEGDLNAARAQYESALRLRPGYADAHFNLARTLQETGESAAAVVQFESGLASAPSRAGVYRELGTLYAEMGVPALARACFERALRLDPENADARRDLTAIRAGEGAPEGAAPVNLPPSACLSAD